MRVQLFKIGAVSGLITIGGVAQGLCNRGALCLQASALFGKLHHADEGVLHLAKGGQRRPLVSERRLIPPRCGRADRSEEHTSELQSLMRISYAVFCLKKKTTDTTT